MESGFGYKRQAGGKIEGFLMRKRIEVHRPSTWTQLESLVKDIQDQEKENL